MTRNKVIEIDSLSKFIRHINRIENVSYYRGEDAVYPSRQSSALRQDNDKWNSAEPFPFRKMIDEFYKETAHKLNEGKGDFIAFAQHHNIPTNLLDVTTSPLTALYFASQGENTAEGVVYMGVNEFIDVTDLIHKYPNESLIESVFSNTINELMLLVPIFTQFKKSYPNEFSSLLSKLIRSYLHHFSSPLDDKQLAFCRMLKRRNFDIWECLACFMDAFEEISTFPLYGCDEEVYLYLALQYIYFKKASDGIGHLGSIDFLPNMIYQPIMKFERGRNQQGLFLYQGYMTYIESVYNYRVLASQQIHFQSAEFRIKNKAMILKELDKIGINKKTLFCDYDSIAEYITDKYSVKKSAD